MYYQFVKTPGEDDSYDIVVNFTDRDTEFGLDFFSKENREGYKEKIRQLIKSEGKDFKVRSVKIVASGILITSMSLSSFLGVHGAERYSMSYLYFGNTAQQTSYVERTKGSLNTVSPSYFDINSDGTLKINTIDKSFVNRMHADNIKVVPFVSNHWNRSAGKSFLKNYDAMATQIANAVATYNLDGVNVDIENVTDTERDQYTAFTASLRKKIPAGKEVSVAVAANPNGQNTGWQGSYDYAALAKNADYLMIMTYDEHWEGGDAGPVASTGFVEKSIQYALSKTTKDKIVVGLPFYGRIWGGNGKFDGDGVGNSTVQTIISRYNAAVTFDHTAGSPKATFTVKSSDPVTKVNGQDLTPGIYTIWYENDDSIAAKIALVNKYDLKGAGSWALGQENATLWDNYSTWLSGDQKGFADVKSSDWYATAVTFMQDREIVNTEKVYFRPNQAATRAECVAWLMKAYGIKPDKEITTQFSDVNPNSEYAAYIATAKRLGITSGTGENKFAPDKELTREEMFTLLYNTFTSLGTNLREAGGNTLAGFKDSGEVSPWARNELDALVRGGIISGTGDNKIMPKQKATRAQLSQVIYTLLR